MSNFNGIVKNPFFDALIKIDFNSRFYITKVPFLFVKPIDFVSIEISTLSNIV